MNATKLALLGGSPAITLPPEQFPRFSPEAIARVTQVLEKGISVGLNKTVSEIEEAEKAIAVWQGVEFCLGTSSGHAARPFLRRGNRCGGRRRDRHRPAPRSYSGFE